MIEIIQLFKHCGTENKEICLVFNITQNYVIKICSREILYLFRTSYLQTFFFFQDILRISALHIFWWTLGKQMQGGHPFCCTFFPKKATCSSEAVFFCPDSRAVLLHCEFKAVSNNNHCESSGDTAGWFPISWCLTALQKPSPLFSLLHNMHLTVRRWSCCKAGWEVMSGMWGATSW